MKNLSLLIIWLVLTCGPGYAQDWTDDQVADAIYRAENSVKFPYGIKSIDTKGNKEYARKICLNSIRNARKRWIKAGKPEDFITYMGRRFSPPNINPNWVRLVRYFLTKGRRQNEKNR